MAGVVGHHHRPRLHRPGRFSNVVVRSQKPLLNSKTTVVQSSVPIFSAGMTFAETVYIAIIDGHFRTPHHTHTHLGFPESKVYGVYTEISRPGMYSLASVRSGSGPSSPTLGCHGAFTAPTCTSSSTTDHFHSAGWPLRPSTMESFRSRVTCGRLGSLHGRYFLLRPGRTRTWERVTKSKQRPKFWTTSKPAAVFRAPRTAHKQSTMCCCQHGHGNQPIAQHSKSCMPILMLVARPSVSVAM